jgi:hypothetical protein
VFEFILVIAAAIAMSRFAEADRGEGLKWGSITFGLCLASFVIPLPFLRILLACGLAFILMTVTKKTFY